MVIYFTLPSISFISFSTFQSLPVRIRRLELGPLRTLLYGAIAGACAKVATYPFEVVRRQLQLQVQTSKIGVLATGLKIVEQGGILALCVGLIPILL
ncbi:hypothetical protein GOBAR_DD14677 [Gossypium barbadense]|nr:hypothetical protein GOBAR_DD14677 [Gossypium barbadense]